MAITTTRTLPAQFIEDLGRDYGKQISALTSLPMDTSKFAPTVAAQDPLQTAAYQQATDATTGLGAYQPFLTKATTAADAATALTGTGAGTGAGSIASYMSPYQSDVISTALAEFDKQAAMRQQDISDAALGVPGAYGGGREGVLQSEYQSTSDKNRAALQAGLLQQGFQQAQQARQQDLMNQLTLGGAQAGLAQGQMGLGQYQQGLASLTPQLAGSDIGTLSQVGRIQQDQSQAVLDAQAQANQMAAMEPYQRMGIYGSGVAQLGQMPGQVQTTVAPDPTALQTALGTMSVLGGIMNPYTQNRYTAGAADKIL